MFEFIEDLEVRAQHQKDYDTALASAVTKQVADTIEVETEGLKNKNIEILKEKKKLADIIEGIGGDPEAAKAALKFLSENEDAKLIQEGKIDDLLAKRTSQITTDFETKFGELTQELQTAKDFGSTYESMYKTKIIEDGIRAEGIKAGIVPTAIDDLLLQAGSIFSLGDDNSIEARDKDSNLRKINDTIVMTPTNWIESLKETKPHYWPASTSANLTGGGGTPKDIAVKLEALLKAGKIKAYRELRAKMK